MNHVIVCWGNQKSSSPEGIAFILKTWGCYERGGS